MPAAPEPVPVAVFSVAPILVVTLEGEEHPTPHVNVGGQGPWVARAIATLGGRPVLCAPFGGDTGRAARVLLADAGMDVVAIDASAGAGLYLEHRDDSGDRHCLQEVAAGALLPRELDDVYQSALEKGIETGACVVTGSPFDGHLAADVVRRLCSDLHAAGVVVVADVSGDHLEAALEAGVDWLKVADTELRRDGRCDPDDEAAVAGWLDDVVDRGCVRVAAVASSGTGPTLVRTPRHRIEVEGPRMEVVDTRGSGDAMCAALALAHRRNHTPTEAVRLGVAAGAANATRRSTAAPGIEAVLRLESVVQDRSTVVERPSEAEAEAEPEPESGS